MRPVVVAWLALAAALLALIMCVNAERGGKSPLLIQTAAPTAMPRICRGLEPHPCARINCTRRIA